MHQFVRLIVVGALLSLATLSPGFASSGTRATVDSGSTPLSTADRHLAFAASRLAVRGPHAAVAWIRRSVHVRSVTIGLDKKTILVTFRDGGQLAILPRASVSMNVHGAIPMLKSFSRTATDGSSGRAVVLEPFAGLLGHEATYGQAEADVLTRAGFHTDVLRNRQVTLESLKGLANYSMVYMETHSGVLPDGDAIIVVDETDAGPYASLFDDGSVMQATVAGGGNALYLAIKSNFIKLHVGQFPDSSLLFLNGCAVTNGPKFWSALHAHNAGTLIGWDHEVAASDDEAASAYILRDLSLGNSVAHAVSAAIAIGLGTSTQFGAAHLGYLGDGDNTLPRALANATPTPLPTLTALPTDVPATLTPTPIPVVGHFRVQVVKSLRVRALRDLRVKVSDGDAGTVVTNARVRLNARATGLSPVLTQRTGRLGFATFKKLYPTRAGLIVLRVTKSGYAGMTKRFRIR